MEDLVQYIRKKRGGQRVKAGVMIARKVKRKDRKEVLVGWSKCKLSADKFDPQRGREIAEARIEARIKKGRKTKAPPSIKDDLKKFMERCERYFDRKPKQIKLA